MEYILKHKYQLLVLMFGFIYVFVASIAELRELSLSSPNELAAALVYLAVVLAPYYVAAWLLGFGNNSRRIANAAAVTVTLLPLASDAIVRIFADPATMIVSSGICFFIAYALQCLILIGWSILLLMRQISKFRSAN